MCHNKCFAGSLFVRVFLGKWIAFVQCPILIRATRRCASHYTYPTATNGNIDRIEWNGVGYTNLIVLYVTLDNWT